MCILLHLSTYFPNTPRTCVNFQAKLKLLIRTVLNFIKLMNITDGE